MHLYYHPVMGITIFVLSVVLAYFIGKWAVKKSRQRWQARYDAPVPDAAAPDAPWIEDKDR